MSRISRFVLFLAITAMFVLVHGPEIATTDARFQDFGDFVTIYDESGASIGQLSVYGIYDPLEIVEPGNELEPGTHHVLIEVGFFNTGVAPLPYDPEGLLLVDTNGFAYTRTMINNLTADSTNYFGQAGTVEPSSDFYGDNAYVVPDGAVIERVVYSSGINHISAYDMRTEKISVGTATPLNDSAGLSLGQVGVVSVTDPFEAHDAATAPADGSRYVAVEAMIANQGQQSLAVALSDFRVVDALGRLFEPAEVIPTDPAVTLLAAGDVQPGGTAQGVVIYQVPEASSIAQVTFADGGTRDLIIADFDAAASLLDATGGCAGFVDWAVNTLGSSNNVMVYLQNLQGANPATLDAGMLSLYYQEAASLLEQQRATAPPPAVESVNTYVLDEFLAPVTTSLETLMNSVAAGDIATAQTALDDLSALSALFSPGSDGEAVIMGMQSACPDEWEELMTFVG